MKNIKYSKEMFNFVNNSLKIILFLEEIKKNYNKIKKAKTCDLIELSIFINYLRDFDCKNNYNELFYKEKFIHYNKIYTQFSLWEKKILI